MGEKDNRSIVKQIQRLCEKQYRKGFQQGYIACQQKELTEEDVFKFRFNGMKQGYSKVQQPTTGIIEDSSERLLSEMAMPAMTKLRNLFLKNKVTYEKD